MAQMVIAHPGNWKKITPCSEKNATTRKYWNDSVPKLSPFKCVLNDEARRQSIKMQR